tara:strand:- start:511 stop:1875 length:1365 start_codon:yes stop_codon:yes gene_type:complete
MRVSSNSRIPLLINLILIGVLICIFGFVLWKEKNIDDRDIIQIYNYYYIIIIISIIFWVCLLFFDDKIKINIFLMACSIFVGIYIIELILTYIPTKKPADILIQKLLKEKNIIYDNRTRMDMVNILNQNGLETVPAIPPTHNLDQFTILDGGKNIMPISGVSKKFTVHCKEQGTWEFYTSDRHGFNNPKKVWEISGKKWVLTGDSFVLGSCVKNKENISQRLSSIMNIPVISLGYGGNGPLLELATIVEYAKYIKPEKLLWFYYEDDFQQLHREKQTLLKKYLTKNYSQNLINKQNYVDNKLIKMVNDSIKNKIINTPKKNILDIVFDIITVRNIRSFIIERIKRFTFVPDIELFKKILIKADKIVKEWGGDLYFVYLPGYSRIAGNISFSENPEKYTEVIKLVKDLGIQVIDINKNVFEKQKNPLKLFPLGLQGHYNSHGYKLISDEIVKLIK